MNVNAMITTLKSLKLFGMADTIATMATQASPAYQQVVPILENLLKAEVAEREVRSVSYQMKVAKFPAYRDLTGFKFSDSQVDEALVRSLHRCEFMDDAQNVVLVGGPGTGKTQVVALRVANILEKTHARPANILCLTFSKSGSLSMRRRLRDIIGAHAYDVKVDTIHGFCNDIIIRHPHVFEEWALLKQISDIERYRVREIIVPPLFSMVRKVERRDYPFRCGPSQ